MKSRSPEAAIALDKSQYDKLQGVQALALFETASALLTSKSPLDICVFPEPQPFIEDVIISNNKVKVIRTELIPVPGRTTIASISLPTEGQPRFLINVGLPFDSSGLIFQDTHFAEVYASGIRTEKDDVFAVCHVLSIRDQREYGRFNNSLRYLRRSLNERIEAEEAIDSEEMQEKAKRCAVSSKENQETIRYIAEIYAELCRTIKP